MFFFSWASCVWHTCFGQFNVFIELWLENHYFYHFMLLKIAIVQAISRQNPMTWGVVAPMFVLTFIGDSAPSHLSLPPGFFQPQKIPVLEY